MAIPGWGSWLKNMVKMAIKAGPGFDFYDHDTTSKNFKPEEQGKDALEHRASSKLDPALLPGAGEFEAYKKARPTDATTLLGSKKEILDKLKDPAKSNIPAALELSDSTIKAIAEFEANIKALKDRMNSPFNAEDVSSYLLELYSDMHAKIKDQHQKEITALEKCFETDKSGLDDSQIKDLIDLRKEAQKKELEAFDKQKVEKMKPINTVAQHENEKYFSAASLMNESRDLKIFNEKEYAEKVKLAGRKEPLSVGQAATPAKSHLYRDFMLGKKINIRGVDINITPPTSPGAGVNLHVAFPNTIISAFGFYSTPENRKTLFMALAAGVKTAEPPNNKSITASVKHDDQETASKMGREFYAACRAAGFVDKDITNMVNGKKMSRDELFKDCPDELQAIETEAAGNDKAREEALKSIKTQYNTNDFRLEVEAIRDSAKAAAEAEAAKTAAAAATAAVATSPGAAGSAPG